MKNKFIILICALPLFARAQDEIIINGDPCGLHGTAKEGTKEYDQDPFKNRYSFPSAADFDATLQLSNFLDGSAIEGKYTQSKAVDVTGYVYNVKQGGKESCNCKTDDPAFKDTHIELTLNDHDVAPQKRFIVEVTPRMRQIMIKKGVDWSTEALIKSLKGHIVRIKGWLFYDFSHKSQNYADNPGGHNIWRATSWEIHPITSIEVVDADDGDTSPTPPTPDVTGGSGNDHASNPQTPNNTVPNHNSTPIQNTPFNILVIVLLGAILGMVGQGLRVIVGLKKVGDAAAGTNSKGKDLFDLQRLVISLFIAFAIGAIAGVLASLESINLREFPMATVMAIIAAGYAGTDFIEGFIRKNPSVTK